MSGDGDFRRVLRLFGMELHPELGREPCPGCGAARLTAVSDAAAALCQCGACGWEIEVERPAPACDLCDGRGEINVFLERSVLGPSETRPCPKCGGRGA